MMLEIIFCLVAAAAIGTNIRRKYWGSALLLTFLLCGVMYLFSISTSVRLHSEPIQIAKGVKI